MSSELSSPIETTASAPGDDQSRSSGQRSAAARSVNAPDLSLPSAHTREPPRRAGTSISAWLVFLVVCIAGLSCDLMTKDTAFGHVADEPIIINREVMVSDPTWQPPPHDPVVIVKHVLNLQLVMNPGAVFGIGPGQRWFFVIFTVLAISVGLCLFAFRTQAKDHLAHVALALVLAGAIGNLYDRLLIGAVRDFLNLFPGMSLPFGWRWPGGNPDVFPWVFNVADMLLLMGIGLLMFRLNRPRRPDVAASRQRERTH